MNDDIARALLEFVEVLYKAVDALAEDPDRTADALVLLVSAIEATVENYGNNRYDDNDRQVVRSLIDLAAAEMAGLVLVAGTTTLLAPGAGVIAIAIATVGAGEFLGQWLETNRISFFPSVQDASMATQGVTLYGYAPLGDTLTSSMHDDRVFGFSGNDYIVNCGGSDAVFGGLGVDTLDYSTMTFASTGGIIVDATAGDGSFVVHHHSDTDIVTEVEHIIATAGADAFVLGNYGANIAGGGHIETIEAGAGDDVALLLNEGGAGPRRVAIDGGSGIDTVVIASDGFNTEIDFNVGALRYHGGVNAQFTIANFEAAQGGDGSDVMLGSDRAEYLLGNSGADRLFGGGGDDFIFFDAGCDGDDTIIVSGASESLFAAGGAGADTFHLAFGDEESPRVLWGGAGADTFIFDGGATSGFAMTGGIAVVSIPGLTEAAFAKLTLADLDLAGLPLNEFRAIIINPDALDRFEVQGAQYNTALDLEGSVFRSHSSDFISAWMGRPVSVQGHYASAYETQVMAGVEWDDMENVLSIGWFAGTWNASGEPDMHITEYDPFEAADQRRAREDVAYYNENLISIVVQPDTHPDYAPWNGPIFVVGGTFSGAALSGNGDLTGTLPGDTGPSPFDWLLAA